MQRQPNPIRIAHSNDLPDERYQRRLMLVIDAIAGVFLLWCFTYTSFGDSRSAALFAMLAWACVFGMHCLHLVYAELRDWLVARAIVRERQAYRFDKPKRQPSIEPISAREWIDIPVWDEMPEAEACER